MVKDKKELEVKMNLLFEKLFKKGIRLNINKCKFFKNAVDWLETVINQEGITVDKTRLLPLKQLKKPTSEKLLRTFLESVNYYSRFVLNFSVIASPLYEMLKRM